MTIHNCSEYKTEFRVVRGTSHEGVSIRTIYYDKNNKICGWDVEPVSPLASNVKDLLQDIVEAVENLDDMLTATKLPILEESQLESEYVNKVNHA